MNGQRSAVTLAGNREITPGRCRDNELVETAVIRPRPVRARVGLPGDKRGAIVIHPATSGISIISIALRTQEPQLGSGNDIIGVAARHTVVAVRPADEVHLQGALQGFRTLWYDIISKVQKSTSCPRERTEICHKGMIWRRNRRP